MLILITQIHCKEKNYNFKNCKKNSFNSENYKSSNSLSSLPTPIKKY